MNCPNDNTVLTMTDRQGIEIDYCPQCRGVWLDRGELDKLIERANVAPQATAFTAQPMRQESPRHDTRPYEQPKQYREDEHYRKKHRKEGFLGDFFDF